MVSWLIRNYNISFRILANTWRLREGDWPYTLKFGMRWSILSVIVVVSLSLRNISFFAESLRIRECIPEHSMKIAKQIVHYPSALSLRCHDTMIIAGNSDIQCQCCT